MGSQGLPRPQVSQMEHWIRLCTPSYLGSNRGQDLVMSQVKEKWRGGAGLGSDG